MDCTHENVQLIIPLARNIGAKCITLTECFSKRMLTADVRTAFQAFCQTSAVNTRGPGLWPIRRTSGGRP